MIETVFDRSKDLAVHICTGTITKDELFRAVKNFYDSEPTAHNLWNFSSVELSDIAPKDLKDLAMFPKMYAASRVGGRTAIVADKAVHFGLARMYENYAELEEQDVEIMVFRTLDQAMKWIEEGG